MNWGYFDANALDEANDKEKVVQGDNWGDLRAFGLVIFTTKAYN